MSLEAEFQIWLNIGQCSKCKDGLLMLWNQITHKLHGAYVSHWILQTLSPFTHPPLTLMCHNSVSVPPLQWHRDSTFWKVKGRRAHAHPGETYVSSFWWQSGKTTYSGRMHNTLRRVWCHWHGGVSRLISCTHALTEAGLYGEILLGPGHC